MTDIIDFFLRNKNVEVSHNFSTKSCSQIKLYSLTIYMPFNNPCNYNYSSVGIRQISQNWFLEAMETSVKPYFAVN